MGYRVKGTLKLPDGSPASNAEIEFISRKNFSPLVQELKSNILCGPSGAYDVTLELGEYAVMVYPGGTYPAALGTIVLAADTVAGQDLPTLLQQAGWQPATPEYIQQISRWLVEANSSATNAAASASSAASTLANVVPKTRTVNGKALSADIALSAVDVGAVPLTGGTVNGGINLSNGTNYVYYRISRTQSSIEHTGEFTLSGNNAQLNFNDGSVDQGLIMKGGGTVPYYRYGTTDYPIYSTKNKPTAADIQNVVSPVASGGIIERGSNANGEYVKFADGTMICTGTVVVAANTYTSVWTFPVAFSATPMCHSLASGAASGVNAGVFVNEHSSTSSTSLTVKTLLVKAGEINQIGANTSSRVTAIGRWK